MWEFNFGNFLDEINHLNTSKVVDTERYDIIEKPEWKKRRLQDSVDKCKILIDFYQSQSDDYLRQKKSAENELIKLQKELSSL
jgi:hypothetical protein